MKWIKGIGLFLIANFLIYITLSVTANLLINFVLPAFGIDVRGVFSQQLLVWSLVIGFGGAFISLAFSKQMARAMLNCQQITQPRVAGRTGDLRVGPRDRSAAGYRHAGGLGLRIARPQCLRHRSQ